LPVADFELFKVGLDGLAVRLLWEEGTEPRSLSDFHWGSVSPVVSLPSRVLLDRIKPLAFENKPLLPFVLLLELCFDDFSGFLDASMNNETTDCERGYLTLRFTATSEKSKGIS
jgi:hypothetical protein